MSTGVSIFTLVSRIFHVTDFGMAYDSAIGDMVFRPGARLSMNYFLDTTDLVSLWLGRDVVDSLVFLAILGENYREPSFTQNVAPKPASITALARTLDMPYETVRRHTLALSASGFCQKQKGGYVVPDQPADHPNLEDLLREIAGATQSLLTGLVQIGSPLACPARLDLEPRAARMAIRYYVEGMVGVCQSLNMDVIRAVILLNIVRRNLSAFEIGEAANGFSESPAQWNAQDKRQAVSTYWVAKTLRLPYETVRRHCRALLEQGAVETGHSGGLLVTRRQLGTSKGRAATQSVWSATKDFLESLTQMTQALAEPAYS